jgi:formylglycine-generating enzyme required for sulfatase activity
MGKMCNQLAAIDATPMDNFAVFLRRLLVCVSAVVGLAIGFVVMGQTNALADDKKVTAPANLPMPRLPLDAAKASALRTEWSQAFGLEVETTNSVGMKLALIPGGRFDMGPGGSKDRATIAKPFYLGTTEVTMGQYRKWKEGHKVEGAEAPFNDDDRPAAMVSWNDAREFCEWLTSLNAERNAGRIYSLPTAAQWEWAARAGTDTSRYFGETDKGQAEYSWFNVTYTPNPKTETGSRGRQPVGKLKPNAWGLYDMLGNVWEWCADRPSDPAIGETHEPSMRGGSWRSGAFHCTAVAHDPGDANLRADNVGFRVACRISNTR